MNYTSNYALRKPLPQEAYNIADFNFNADVLDAKVQRFATVTISAADALNKAADLVCSGTDDDLVFAQAIALLPAEGGKILISEGTFSFGDTVTIGKANVTIEGCGAASVITSSTDCLFAITAPDITIKSLWLESDYVPVSSSNAIVLLNGAEALSLSEVRCDYYNGVSQAYARIIVGEASQTEDSSSNIFISGCRFSEKGSNVSCIAYLTSGSSLNGVALMNATDKVMYYGNGVNGFACVNFQ